LIGAGGKKVRFYPETLGNVSVTVRFLVGGLLEIVTLEIRLEKKKTAGQRDSG